MALRHAVKLVYFALHFLLFSSLAFLFQCSQHENPSFTIEVASVGLNTGSLNSDGTAAVVGSIYHGVSFWDLEKNERLYNWNHQEEQNTVLIASQFSPENRWALTAQSHSMVLWNTQTGGAARYWAAPAEILDVALATEGQAALLGLSNHTAVLFNVNRGGILRTFNHANRVRSVDLNIANRLAITGSEDTTAKLWDLETGKERFTLSHNDDVRLVRLSPDASHAFSMSQYDQAVIWSTRTGEPLYNLPLRSEHLKRGLMYTAVRFNRENTLLLAGRTDQIVELWQFGESTITLAHKWKVPKRDPWKPTGAAITDLNFHSSSASDRPENIIVLASNGFIHRFALPSSIYH